MRNIVQSIKTEFPKGLYNPPCTEAMIAEAQTVLCHTIPQPFRELYLAFDGFRATRHTQFLYRLLIADTPASALVKDNVGFRWQWSHLKRYMLFGLTIDDKMWAVDLEDQRTIVTIELLDTQNIRPVGTDLLTVYIEERDRHLRAVGEAS